MIPLSELVFRFGDTVWHKTDGDAPGVVIGYVQRPGVCMYEVTRQGRTTDTHFECELTHERPKYSASEPTENTIP